MRQNIGCVLYFLSHSDLCMQIALFINIVNLLSKLEKKPWLLFYDSCIDPFLLLLEEQLQIHMVLISQPFSKI